MAKRKASVTDLSTRQVERIELATGYPVNRWVTEAPKATLYPLILAELNGDDIERYKDMPFGKLIEMVGLDAEADDDDPEGS